MSDLMTSGCPNVASTLSSTGMRMFADTEKKISAIGYLEYLSIRTMSSSPDGKGPKKSTLNFLQGPVGISDISMGSRCGFLLCALVGETLTYCCLNFVVHFRKPYL